MRMNITPQGSVNNAMQLVYETTLTEATEEISITGLTGDTATLYELVVLVESDYDGSHYIWILCNSDTNNYGYQLIQAVSTTETALRLTGRYGLYIGLCPYIDYYSYSKTLIYPKSGIERLAFTKAAQSCTGATIGAIMMVGQTWNNTADEITSLQVKTTAEDGLGINTYVALYERGVVV